LERIKILPSLIHGAAIDTGISDSELAQQIMDGQIIVLKNVFPSDEARLLRQLAFEWGSQQTPSSQADFYALKHFNHFCIERGVSGGQKTLHYYQSYNFSNFRDGLPPQLTSLLTTFCSCLRDLYNRITGHTADFKSEPRLHPQVLYYPSGAGLFAKHTHLLEPQKIGTITLLSKFGLDFKSGGAGFEVEDDLVDLTPFQDVGDVALFRFDLPHWVSPVEIEEAVDRNSNRGRWTLTLSYY
jgi:hypothetical protein